MKVGIVGGTGFVGRYLIDELQAAGHSVCTLVRPGSESKLQLVTGVETVAGDVFDERALRELFDGCDAAIYSVGILREFPRRGVTFEAVQFQGMRHTLAAATHAGVSRLLVMSAIGAKASGTRYQTTKYRAEQVALESGLDVTVLRPSVIFGDPRGAMEFATQLRNDMVRPPIPAIKFFPGFRPKARPIVMAPVHVEDVARSFVVVLEDADSVGKTYELAGPDVLTWRQMITRVGESVGRNKWFIPMPIPLMRLAATVLDWLPFFPVTRDQLTMLEEGNVADPDTLEMLVRREPKRFEANHLRYLAE
ncbi:MAG: NAD(P)H-binding protein [Pseudomonadota bacterium]